MDINSGGAVFFCVFDGGDEGDGGGGQVLRQPTAAQSEYYTVIATCSVVPHHPPASQGGLGGGEHAPAGKGDVPGAPVPPADGREGLRARRGEATVARTPARTPDGRGDGGGRREDAEAVAAEAVREDADAAEALARCLEGNQAGLVMRYVRSPRSRRSSRAFSADSSAGGERPRPRPRLRARHALANPDRLPCSRLMWRGNPGTCCTAGRGNRRRRLRGGGSGWGKVRRGHRSGGAPSTSRDASQAGRQGGPAADRTAAQPPPHGAGSVHRVAGRRGALEAAGLDPNEVADGDGRFRSGGAEDAGRRG